MPLTLTVTHQPKAPLRTRAEALPLWQRLHRLADVAAPKVQELWQGVLEDLRTAVEEDEAAVLTAATQHPLFGVEPLFAQLWDQAVVVPVEQYLPLVLQPLLTASAEASLPALAAETQVAPIPYTPSTPETQQQLDTYVQQQLTLITGTTLLALRLTLRQAGPRAASPAALARQVMLTAGLTPQQATHITRVDTTLAEQGRSRAARAAQLRAVGQRSVLLRSAGIAETQTMGVVNLGIDAALSQAMQRGLVAQTGIRRYWQVTPPDVCERCLAMAALYPQGVAVGETFYEGGSPVARPPLHARCKCIIALRRV